MTHNAAHFHSKAKHTLETKSGNTVTVYSLKKLADLSGKSVERLPYAIRVILENMLRHYDGQKFKASDIESCLNWEAKSGKRPEVPLMPSRVIMQDFTGVPAAVDLASMRNAFEKEGGDPDRINPLVETALVVDHSVQVDYFGNAQALGKNVELEYQRNKERYTLLKWAQNALHDFKVVPPGMGICHQVNLEYLAKVVMTKTVGKETIAYPDSLVGTDSHTTMINALGVLGWGVGGIEAEAVMLGQPYYMVLPDVVGVRLLGRLKEGVTATDLVLTVTELLRKKGVVEKFVEFFGPGLAELSLPDRATIANMAPEYGATTGFFAVDEETCRYLKQSNRAALIDYVEPVCEELMLLRRGDAPEPDYTDIVELDLGSIGSTLAGPKRPQDRVSLQDMKSTFLKALEAPIEKRGYGLTEKQLGKKIKLSGSSQEITHGAVVIAAITSCTNTSNPFVMLGAGLVARNAVQKGLSVKPYVKTSLAPGSGVVTDYLIRSGLMVDLEKLGFHVVGYGCTTCIGNSGALPSAVIEAVQEGDLVVAGVLSGNRNFEGRINPHVKANYLASPLLVVAYALAGSVDFDFSSDPLGQDANGERVFLKDIWPSTQEIQNLVDTLITPSMYQERYQTIFDGTEAWQDLKVPAGNLYHWKKSSTYIQNPPFFENFAAYQGPKDIIDANVLALLGDSVTTDHISPAGSIDPNYPAGTYLKERGVEAKDFNSYGARRGNHEVMMRGTLANVRLRNLLIPGVEGGFTKHRQSGETLYIYDAAMAYKKDNIPLILICGKEYGTGSSRDWAAKGTYLLGVKAVIAESYERIHRSNLVGMGVLPLQFLEHEGREALQLDGSEVYTIRGLAQLSQGQTLAVEARSENGALKIFQALVRLDTEVEVDYYKNGGILQTVLLNMMKTKK